ncbi:quinol monooxygenase YgiN [Bradyrhizobium sp. JR3.5]
MSASTIPICMWSVERWETRDDLTAHSKAPHMKVWREYSAEMKTGPTVIEIISDAKVQKL